MRGGVNDVGNDGAARRHIARAPAVEHDVAHAVALQIDGVKGTVDGGERVLVLDERGMHARLDALLPVFADGEKF